MPQRVLADELTPLTAVEISALNNTGYDELSREISRACDLGLLDSSDAVLISERQYDCARRALEALSGAREAILSGITLDAVSVCIDDAIAAFLELTGKRVTNEVADEVFKRFCVGK
jgi:tRNA modification GTPase